MFTAALLALGISALWIGTEFAVGSASRFASRFRVTPAIVGLTILAIGTDLPELVVSISAGVEKLGGEDTSGIAIGNAIGSGVTQITFVLGIAGLTGAVKIGRTDLIQGSIAMFVAMLLALTVSVDGTVTRVEGGLLIGVYGAYLVLVIMLGRAESELTADGTTLPAWVDGVLLLAGLGLVVGGAELVVEYGARLAENLDVDQALIAILVVAFGTSLPELAISLRSAAEGKAGLSVGNIIGSNVFDLLTPIGVAGLIAGLEVDGVVTAFDLPFLMAASGLAIFLLWTGDWLARREALILLGVYVVYGVARSGLEAF